MSDTTTSGRALRGEARGLPDARRPQVRWASEYRGDVDEVAIQRLLAGETTIPVNAFERREAVRRLRLRGFSYTAIAGRLDIDTRQVGRDLRRLGISEHRVLEVAS